MLISCRQTTTSTKNIHLKNKYKHILKGKSSPPSLAVHTEFGKKRKLTLTSPSKASRHAPSSHSSSSTSRSASNSSSSSSTSSSSRKSSRSRSNSDTDEETGDRAATSDFIRLSNGTKAKTYAGKSGNKMPTSKCQTTTTSTSFTTECSFSKKSKRSAAYRTNNNNNQNQDDDFDDDDIQITYSAHSKTAINTKHIQYKPASNGKASSFGSAKSAASAAAPALSMSPLSKKQRKKQLRMQQYAATTTNNYNTSTNAGRKFYAMDNNVQPQVRKSYRSIFELARVICRLFFFA